ncbi:hypothetical protein VST7929_01616 [Vibrio stylophorae]|uniref:Uncharacterized protein n=1 Tax=Vibrio stylophorae TaxID=659351 RepID=A0ABN8DUR5_9VIBR|nr:hypothetical protein VST7929_01616 [Vibrio stylophorae]
MKPLKINSLTFCCPACHQDDEFLISANGLYALCICGVAFLIA